ncbi:MAG: hypothetical protein NUW21_02120 [Elusimicrobia bacterium]|nr:hypothetical protein [Elusimicrobiota bacterium]
MRRLLLAAALLPAAARAERTPTEDAKAPILKAVRDGMAARDAMHDAMLERDSVSDDPEIALLHWTAARTAQSKMKSDFDLAIRLTQDAYRLKPQTPSAPRAVKPLSADGAWAAGLSAPWAPEFGPPGHREIRGMDGWLHYVSVDPKDAPTPDDVFAFTDPDGKVTIMPSLFERIIRYNEPGLLASAIHHEGVHYSELISTGWDTHEQMELRADRESLAMVDVFMSGLSSKIRGEVKDGLRKRIAEAEALVGSGNTRSPFPDAEQEKRFEEKFRRQERRGLEYDDLVRRVERLRRDRRDRLEAARRDFRWAKFSLWTLNACVYMDGTRPNSPEWGRPDLIRAREQALRGYLRGNLVVLPSGEIDAGLARGDRPRIGDLAHCQERMIRMIRYLPAPVDADWMMARIEYERRGGRAGEIISGVIESVRRAVADGTAALASAASPGAATRGPGEPVRDPGGGDRGSSLPGGENPPLDRLRGINAGDSW